MITTAKPSIENLERILAQLESVRHLTHGPGLSQFNVATATLAQLHLFDILNRFDSRKLSKRLEEKPELWFQLINAFCNFSRLQLARDKFEWQKKQAEARQRAREEKQRARTPIVITATTVHSLRALLKTSPVHTDPPAAAKPAAMVQTGQCSDTSLEPSREPRPLDPESSSPSTTTQLHRLGAMRVPLRVLRRLNHRQSAMTTSRGAVTTGSSQRIPTMGVGRNSLQKL
jgi:hypothetical protein